MAIEKRTLGRTGLDVTILGYGAMELRHDKVDDEQASKLLNAVLDGGINFIDTAPDYGKSEDMIGKHIAHRRDEYILATKCGCPVPADPAQQEPHHKWSADRLMANIDSSLKRLKTDHVDIWQLHSGLPEEVEGTDVLEAMERARQQGKVRFLAYSTKGRAAGDQGKALLEHFVQWDIFDAMQVVFSALNGPTDALMNTARDRRKGLIVRGLTNVKDEEWARWEAQKMDDLLPDGCSRHQFLLRFGFSHPALCTSIPGTANLDHLAENIAAAEQGPLDDALHLETRKRLGLGY
ncbi:MAG: aldo/keto reductase [Phycisphaerae bacterium]